MVLAYMTGILPVKKDGVHSALNMFTEYSMVDQDVFEEYTGFTEAEVKALCSRFHMDFEEVSSWYDGYELIKFRHVYTPKSVVEAMRRGRCSNYWTATETYEALKKYNIQTKDDAITLLIHLGYLAYDPVKERAFAMGCNWADQR